MRSHVIGLEIGGPTELLNNSNYGIDLYGIVNLNGLNIPLDNPFQPQIGEKYIYGNKSGNQYVMDISDANAVTNQEKYDLVVMSHVIEHFANPVKVLINIRENLLIKGGLLFSIMPDYRFSFDRNRDLTLLSHMIDDFENNIQEDDSTHIEEITFNHDSSLCGLDNWNELISNNTNTRVAHHHTFDQKSFKQLLDYCGFRTIIQFKIDKLNIVNLSRVKES